jgi:hypothetical protein
MAARCGLSPSMESRTPVCVAAYYRRIVVRWERYPENFLGMIHLASAIILLRHL